MSKNNLAEHISAKNKPSEVALWFDAYKANKPAGVVNIVSLFVSIGTLIAWFVTASPYLISGAGLILLTFIISFVILFVDKNSRSRELVLGLSGITQTKRTKTQRDAPKFVFPYLTAEKRQWMVRSLEGFVNQQKNIPAEADALSSKFDVEATMIARRVEIDFMARAFLTEAMGKSFWMQSNISSQTNLTDGSPSILEEMLRELQSD